jgi:hypothetical protein
MSAELSTAVKRSLKQPGFLMVVGILLAGALGLNAATGFLNLFFRKEALPLRGELSTFTKKDLGGWVWVPEQHTLNPDNIHALGTDKYVMCMFVDTVTPVAGGKPVATKKEVEDLEKLTPEQRWQKLRDFQQKNLYSVINVAVTYYTGKVDTVPHVPDRCYVADGFQPSEYKEETWLLGQYSNGVERGVPVRFIDFEDQTTRGAQNRCVSYFFQANGEYLADHNKVRWKLQNLKERYAYFAKIEVMNVLPLRPGAPATDPLRDKDRAAAAAAMQRFLTAALPEIEKLLPDWQKVTGK